VVAALGGLPLAAKLMLLRWLSASRRGGLSVAGEIRAGFDLAARATPVMAAALVITGCTSTAPGVGVKATDRQNADGVTVALLNPGKYPTEAVPLSVSPNESNGVLLEGQRMATNVVVPSEVDAQLLQLNAFNTGPAENPQALRAVIGRPRAEIAARHRFISGFSTARSTRGAELASAPDTSLVNAVMRFGDPGEGAAAAAEMAAAAPMPRPTRIPRYPDAAASGYDMPGGVIEEAFTAHGPYVLYQWVQTIRPPDVATEMIAKTIDLQGPRIDQFVPTQSAQLAGLPVDQTGLLAHTLPASPDTVAPGVYSPKAAVHFEIDSVKSAAVFTAAGVEFLSLRGATMVYQAKDPDGASRVVDELSADEAEAGATPAEGVAGLPNAKCLSQAGGGRPMFDCYGRVGRYAFKVSSGQAPDARQQAAAQYLMLKDWR
jgi:hypothetical protein